MLKKKKKKAEKSVMEPSDSTTEQQMDIVDQTTMNSGGGPCSHNNLLGLAFQVASAIVLKAIGALSSIASVTVGSLYRQRITEIQPAQTNFYYVPCLCGECKALDNASANPAAPAREVFNTVSCEELIDSSNDAMGSHFPEEIIMDILIRLPVRSLLRFRCVSKFWKTLISTPEFKMEHLNHAKNSQNSQKILISRRCPKDNSMLYYCCSLSLVHPVEDALGFPSNHRPCQYLILSCCNSLALLWVQGEHLLWNPSTNESIVLPNPNPNPNPEFSPSYFKYGFGYDSISVDYKILRINNTDEGGAGQILGLKSSSWRRIDEHPHGRRSRLFGMDSLAYVHGAFHWIGVDMSTNYYVVSFSISNEAYGEIPFPPLAETTRDASRIPCGHSGVSVLGGLLCANYTSRNREACTVTLWVMKEYGVGESWTELFTIRETHLYKAIPKYWFANGEVLLFCEERGNRGFRTSKGPFGSWPRSRVFQQGFVFTESLISPKSLT